MMARRSLLELAAPVASASLITATNHSVAPAPVGAEGDLLRGLLLRVFATLNIALQ